MLCERLNGKFEFNEPVVVNRMVTQFKRSKKGFTLIELLVVIAIIALLLAILLPTLGKVKDQAMYVICKTGLHQYGLGGTMYLNDNDSNFPDAYLWLHNRKAYTFKPSCAWHDIRNDYEQDPTNAGVLWPYIASKKMHVCPKFRRIANVYGPDHPLHDASILVEPQYGYSMNGYLGHGFYSVMKKSTGVKEPANTFFFCEENLWLIDGISTYSLNNNNIIGRRSPYGPDDYDTIFGTWHGMKGDDRNSGDSNAVFLDGSVRKVFKEETFRLGWPK